MARQFIVEDQGRYYVCEVILGYDPDHATNDEQRAGIRQMAAMYEDACNAGGRLSACPYQGDMHEFGPLNTDPPPPPR